MSLKEQLVSYIFRQEGWVHKGQILEEKWYNAKQTKKYMANSVDRDLRIAENERQIAVKEDPNHRGNVYKYIPEVLRSHYIPTSQRPIGQENVLFTPLTL